MTIKEIVKYVMWRMGYRATMPGVFVNRMSIRDNGEILVDLKKDNRLFFYAEMQKCQEVLLRQGAYQRLQKAIEFLPEGCALKVCAAYRSLKDQQELWNTMYKKIKEQNPFWAESDIERKVRSICADPRRGFGGHQTGGAIDVTLCDLDGNEFDMGKYLDSGVFSATFAEGLTQEQQQNRRLLYHTMIDAGFQNYPNEWWHYCYGDRMWAAYQLKRHAIYGLIDKGEE